MPRDESALVALETETPEVEDALELSVTAQGQRALAEVQGAIILAKRFPRDEDAAYASVMKATKRPAFAEKARYVYPRGGKTISGASIGLARQIGRAWGNMEWGIEVTNETDDAIYGMAWAWDMQTNARSRIAFKASRMIQRKQGEGGSTIWIKADERDMREQFLNIGARTVRGCIISLVPADFVDDALASVRETIASKVKGDPEQSRKDIVLAFADLGIKPAELEAYLGKPLEQITPDEIADLKTVYRSVRDGESKWADFLNGHAEDVTAKGTIKVKPSSDRNRGHGGAAPVQGMIS